MYQNELPRDEELLDSTPGSMALPGTTRHITEGQPLASTGDLLDSERPAKRFKPNQPSHWRSSQGHGTPAQVPSSTGYTHQSIPPWTFSQPIVFSSSTGTDLAGNDALPNNSRHNTQDVQPPAAAPLSASRLQPTHQPSPLADKHRRGSVPSEGSKRPRRVSAYWDSKDTVGIPGFHVQMYTVERDEEGNAKVSSYVKFQTSSRREPSKPAQQPLDNLIELFRGGDGRRGQLEIMGLDSSRADSSTTFLPVTTTASAFDEMATASSHHMEGAYGIGTSWSDNASMGFTYPTPSDMPMSAMVSPQQTPSQHLMGGSPIHMPPPAVQRFGEHEHAGMSVGHPKLLPDQFGLQTKMKDYQRRFMNFYVKAWCPGRSILPKTNLWLKDFAPMCLANKHIRYAMDSLVGVYIFDYTLAPSVRDHANTSFARADYRLTELLNKPHRTADEANETITLMVLLAMQDVVFVERRKLFHQRPRWLEGFRECERLLQDMDPRERFWDESRAVVKTAPDRSMMQVDSLQLSLSICVCRAVILAQPLMPLPDSKSFDADKEADRFGWLLTGDKDDMFAIHGGCGFSRMLLFQISQVTFLAAKLRQEGRGTYSYLYAESLLDELLSMRQFNKESAANRNTWEAAKQLPPVVYWVRRQTRDYVITDRDDMTDVTAEAWRVAAMIYLQCRALRLPRDHPEVMSNMNDLASCIRMMPTSGPLFTAQAPLLPVFLLGLLAVEQFHKQISRHWFEMVTSAPVRSSVPPLFDALQDIWDWIDKEIPSGQRMCASVPERDAWWERLVAVVKKTQKETLCLT